MTTRHKPVFELKKDWNSGRRINLCHHPSKKTVPKLITHQLKPKIIMYQNS